MEVKTLRNSNYFPQGSRKRQFLKHFDSIGFIQLITRTILAPIQRWKIISQTQKSYITNIPNFKNSIQYIRRIPKQQGIFSFFRGNGSNCWLYVFQNICRFYYFENINDYWNWETDNQVQYYFTKFMPIVCASFLTQIITYPLQLAKVRLSMSYYKVRDYTHYSGIFDCIRIAKRQEGYRNGVYKGFLLSNITSILYFSIYLNTINLMQQNRSQGGNRFEIMYSNQSIANLIGLIALYPLQTLKHRLQLNNHGKGMMHLNTRHLFKQIMRQQQLVSFYKGLTPSIVKLLLTYQIAFELFQLKQENNIFYF